MTIRVHEPKLLSVSGHHPSVTRSGTVDRFTSWDSHERLLLAKYRSTARRYRVEVITFDMLGYGSSDKPTDAYRGIAAHGLWIGHASRLFADNRRGHDNSHLISLYLREFWFSPMDL